MPLRVALFFVCVTLGLAQDQLSIATFQADVTPPLGCPLEDGAVKPAARIVAPLTARGIVLMGAGKPIVLAAVDWVGIANQGWDEWRAALAEAAGTTPDRVTVHTVHQHDAPGYDPAAERLLERRGLHNQTTDVAFARQAIQRTADSVRRAMKQPRKVTHIGLGEGKVEKVASNRRVPGPDGKVKYVRYSSCRIPEAIAAPEGVIDPYLRMVSFWDGDRAVAALSYYASHPQSYYGEGGVNPDFPGMARSLREAALPGVALVHFMGAGGNVAAGKYNDGSPEMRPVLAKRLAAGMQAAWDATVKKPIRARDVEWRTEPVALPIAERLKDAAALRKTLDNAAAAPRARSAAARNLVWKERQETGKIALTCLRLGTAYVVHMPGELFVEYQLAAEKMRPKNFVAMAAYGDYGPGYIGTRIAYSQGGYETGPPSRVAPEVEDELLGALRRLLR